ncbi:MAG: CotS family spore coat protein, partial [Bacillota bacterium]|nr:CotS family spore coat protein [Bacillota bacterium]
QRVWLIRCLEQEYILKAVSFPLHETEFIIRAMAHLKDGGFHDFNEIIPTKTGEDIVEYQGKYYFLSHRISGTESNYKDTEKIKLCAEFLGEFHKRSGGYKALDPYPGRVKWGNWPNIFSEKKRDIGEFKEIAQNEEEFDILYRRFCPYFIQAIEETEERIKRSKYKELCREEQEHGGFCHHDLAHHNFIIGERVNIIDFDYIIADIRCHDLSNFISKVLKANDWDAEKAKIALSCYDRVNPLKDGETEALKIMLRFPQDFWQCGLARYSEGDISAHNTIKLKRLLKQRNLRSEALKELDKSI